MGKTECVWDSILIQGFRHACESWNVSPEDKAGTVKVCICISLASLLPFSLVLTPFKLLLYHYSRTALVKVTSYLHITKSKRRIFSSHLF